MAIYEGLVNVSEQDSGRKHSLDRQTGRAASGYGAVEMPHGSEEGLIDAFVARLSWQKFQAEFVHVRN